MTAMRALVLVVAVALIAVLVLVLTAGEHVAPLTPLEARAFRFLEAHAGSVVPRETLEREVWGLHQDVESEAVPVAIRQLRKKLGPHRDLLETIRSVEML